MWKANGKTTTLQLFLDSLSPKIMRDSLSGDKLKIALFGDLSLEEAMDLSRDRQILELEVVFAYHWFTPLAVNVVASVHNTAHKKSGSPTVLCRRLTFILVKVTHEKDITIPLAVYASLHSLRDWFHMRPGKC
jgi:hypothetical protein